MPTIRRTFGDPAWHATLRASLTGDSAWCTAARWFSGTLVLRHDDGALQIAVSDGTIRELSAEPAMHGADIVVEAGDAAWQRLLGGELDVVSGIASGELTLSGDVVLAMHHMRLLHATLEAMRGPVGTSTPAFSPDPRYERADVTGRYVEVDGIRTYYEEAGSGIALVCLHAACQDTLMYRHVLDGLSDRFRVITLDAPGHGKTLVPPGGPFTSITQHAAFNERFMEALDLDRPVILGCSMGGNMVLELGARRPSAYRAIVSCEGAAHTPTLDEFTLDMIEANGAVLAGVYARSLTGRRTPPERAEEVVWQLCRATPAMMRADLTGYARFDQREALAAITAPVLLLRGDEDWLVSQEMVEATAAGIADARIAVLEGTGHYPMTENPAEFNDAVAAFLGDVLSAPLASARS